MGVAMGTKYFLVGPNNRNNGTRGNGCEWEGSGWTLGRNFFARAVGAQPEQVAHKGCGSAVLGGSSTLTQTKP